MQSIREIIEKDRFCLETVGIELVDLAPGWAKVSLGIEGRHLNGLGTVQGGCIFTLADLALAAAANAHGDPAVLINAGISYFAAVSEGTLTAEATEVSFHAKLATYIVKVTHESGELVAQMQATVYRKSKKTNLTEA